MRYENSVCIFSPSLMIILMTSEVAAVASAFCSGIFFCRYILHKRSLHPDLSVATYSMIGKMTYGRIRTVLTVSLEIMVEDRTNPKCVALLLVLFLMDWFFGFCFESSSADEATDHF